MDIKSPERVHYLINPDWKEIQNKTLDRLLPIFFRENTIVTDSPIVARVASLNEPNEIEFHLLSNNAQITPIDRKFGSPWEKKYPGSAVSDTIDGVKFTVYYDNTSLCR